VDGGVRGEAARVQDLEIGAPILDAIGELTSAHPRQRQVGDDDRHVLQMLVENRQRFLAGSRFEHSVAMPGESATGETPQ
jgi:hypothetical protein